jgi:hypothetical protein
MGEKEETGNNLVTVEPFIGGTVRRPRKNPDGTTVVKP